MLKTSLLIIAAAFLISGCVADQAMTPHERSLVKPRASLFIGLPDTTRRAPLLPID